MNPESSAAADGIELSDYSPGQSWSVLWALVVVTITLNLAVLPFGQVAEGVRRTFGIDDLQFSLLLGALFAVPSVAMTVGGGWLADRISRRRLLMAAMVAWTSGALLAAFATDFTQLAIGRMIVAAASGIKFPLAMTWISDAFPGARRGRAVGAFFMVVGIAPAVGASLSGVVLQAAESGTFAALPLVGGQEPWRIALALLALANVLPFPWVATLHDARSRIVAVTDDTATAPAVRFPAGLALAMVAVAALLAMADTANLAWLPTVLRRQHGFDARQVGFAFALITTIAGSTGPLLAGAIDGPIYRRFGTAGRLAACGIAAACCAPLLLSFAGRDAHVLVGALVISGAISMMAMTFGFTAIQSLLPSGKRGLGTGLANAASNLASAAAPTSVAFIADRIPAGNAALGCGVAAVTVAAFACTALLAWIAARGLARWHRRDEQGLAGSAATA